MQEPENWMPAMGRSEWREKFLRSFRAGGGGEIPRCRSGGPWAYECGNNVAAQAEEGIESCDEGQREDLETRTDEVN